MAIKDIQQQLIKSEGQSGEFLIKKIKADLNAIYNAGYGDETSPLLDSYWDQALKEFTEEAGRAVKKGNSKGEVMACLSVEDSTATMDSVILFPESWSKNKPLLYAGNTVLLSGKKSSKDTTLIVEKVFQI